jgi:hypothetical protein
MRSRMMRISRISGDTAATVVAHTRTDAKAAEAEHKKQDDQKNKHDEPLFEAAGCCCLKVR